MQFVSSQGTPEAHADGLGGLLYYLYSITFILSLLLSLMSEMSVATQPTLALTNTLLIDASPLGFKW